MGEHSNASRSVFVAGATGAIGRQLLPMLIAAGYEVSGTAGIRRRPVRWRRSGCDRSWSMPTIATR